MADDGPQTISRRVSPLYLLMTTRFTSCGDTAWVPRVRFRLVRLLHQWKSVLVILDDGGRLRRACNGPDARSLCKGHLLLNNHHVVTYY